MKAAYNSKKKNKKLGVVAHVLQNTQNLVISRSCFAEDGKECTELSNARVELLYSSLKLLFNDLLVAVAVVVCLSPPHTGASG